MMMISPTLMLGENMASPFLVPRRGFEPRILTRVFYRHESVQPLTHGSAAQRGVEPRLPD